MRHVRYVFLIFTASILLSLSLCLHKESGVEHVVAVLVFVLTAHCLHYPCETPANTSLYAS